MGAAFPLRQVSGRRSEECPIVVCYLVGIPKNVGQPGVGQLYHLHFQILRESLLQLRDRGARRYEGITPNDHDPNGYRKFNLVCSVLLQNPHVLHNN